VSTKISVNTFVSKKSLPAHWMQMNVPTLVTLHEGFGELQSAHLSFPPVSKISFGNCIFYWLIFDKPKKLNEEKCLPL
jgi:hypothetical protein